MPSKTKVATKGVCSFCESEIDKTKMTQHLKFCKQRTATIAASEADKKETLLQILVEGKYNPQYWMYLEMPASEQLITLDAFLRDIWLECCGHLSAFRIGGTSYADEPDFDDFSFHIIGAPDQESESQKEEEEEIEDLSPEELAKEVGEWFGAYAQGLLVQMPAELGNELKIPRSRDELVVFLKEKLSALPGITQMFKQSAEEARKIYFQKHMLEELLDEVEDRSLGAPLQKVLKVGQKFTHEYDFGSTTYLNLRVLAEREGVADEEDDGVTILARNVAPVILCDKCGAPATQVASEYYSDAYGFCDKCAEASEDSEMLLPVVNSPRIGVCGYTG